MVITVVVRTPTFIPTITTTILSLTPIVLTTIAQVMEGFIVTLLLVLMVAALQGIVVEVAAFLVVALQAPLTLLCRSLQQEAAVFIISRFCSFLDWLVAGLFFPGDQLSLLLTS